MTRWRSDMRRGDPEPAWPGPQVQHTPGLARDMTRELAPLLAEDGISVDADGEIVGEVPDLETLQRALARAVERQNLALFTPVGGGRELAAAALREATEALAAGQSTRARDVLEAVVLGIPRTTTPPPSPVSPASRSGCAASAFPAATPDVRFLVYENKGAFSLIGWDQPVERQPAAAALRAADK